MATHQVDLIPAGDHGAVARRRQKTCDMSESYTHEPCKPHLRPLQLCSLIASEGTPNWTQSTRGIGLAAIALPQVPWSVRFWGQKAADQSRESTSQKMVMTRCLVSEPHLPNVGNTTLAVITIDDKLRSSMLCLPLRIASGASPSR